MGGGLDDPPSGPPSPLPVPVDPSPTGPVPPSVPGATVLESSPPELPGPPLPPELPLLLPLPFLPASAAMLESSPLHCARPSGASASTGAIQANQVASCLIEDLPRGETLRRQSRPVRQKRCLALESRAVLPRQRHFTARAVERARQPALVAASGGCAAPAPPDLHA